MRQLLIRNLRQIVTVSSGGNPWKTGVEMRNLGMLTDRSILIEDDRIRAVGLENDFSSMVRPDAEIVDGTDRIALPGFVDAHTHLVFAGTRENEFALRASGSSYQEIADQGGGILSTVRATREASKRDLKKLARKRLDDLLQYGTTTVEIKSGYGLDPENEIKMLEVIGELAQEHFSTIVPTFLGAHAIPPEYAMKPDAYVELLCTHMLPYIAKRELAAFCDVFCEKGYFSPSQSRKILAEAVRLGLKAKVHAEELGPSGGSSVAADLRAVSADHLEHIDQNGINALKKSGVVAVLLPGVSFFLNHRYAPARQLIDSDVPVALASDFNPGSCMSFSMPLMMTIACTHMNMSPEEAITATTLNAAAALGLSARVGSIEVGKQADIILYAVPDYRYLAYHFGVNHVSTIIKNGTILEFS